MTNNIFISGFPRAGTTMLCLMLNYFENCKVFSDAERHPQDFSTLNTNKDFLVLKQPFGYFDEFPPKYDYSSVESDYGAKIISLVRHPLSVGTSRHANDPSIYWVPIDIIVRNCKEYLKHLKDPNVLFVRYENLVTKPEVELNKVSDFLGCEYSDGFWDFYKHPHASLPKNNSLGGCRAIDTSGVDLWNRSEHIERVKELLDSDLKEYITKLGYSYE